MYGLMKFVPAGNIIENVGEKTPAQSRSYLSDSALCLEDGELLS